MHTHLPPFSYPLLEPGKIAVLGGIQINTPEGMSDYFKPLSFEIYDNSGKLVEDMSSKLET